MLSNIPAYSRLHALLPDITARVMVCAAVAVAAGWDLPIAAADQGTPVVVNCGERKVRPESITLTCADNTWRVDKINWTSWSASGAKGTGIEFRVNCVPNCAQGSATYSPVTITLTGAAPPDFRYTNAVVTNQKTGKSDAWPVQ